MFADRRGHGRVEENVARLQSRQIDAHRLARLKGSHNAPLPEFSAEASVIANVDSQPLKRARGKESLSHIFSHLRHEQDTMQPSCPPLEP